MGAVLLFGSVARATAAAETAALDWHVAVLPGGMAPVATLLGLGPATIPPERFVLELARSTFNIPETQRKSIDDLHSLRVYLETAARLRRGSNDASRDVAGLLEAVGFRRAGAVLVSDDRPLGRERRSVLERAGCDPRALADALLAGQVPAPFDRDARIPVPLSIDTWKTKILKRDLDESAWLPAILGDRQAVFLYAGLLAADLDTLAFLNRSTDLLESIYRDSASAFAAFGRSIVVRDGGVMTPGSPRLAATWESIVGEQTRQPERFVRAMLERDRGRVALAYDTLAQLDPSVLRCAIGSEAPGQSAETLRRVVELFVRLEDPRRLAGGPFSRQPDDTAFLFQVLPCDGSGRLLVPGTRDVWQRVFRDQMRPAAAKRFDAADLIEAISLSKAPDRRQRLETVLFMARVFGARPAPAHASAASLLAIANGFGRFPALLLTLERIGIRSPQLYERAVRQAQQIDNVTGRSNLAAMAQFQASIAILDRCRLVQTLDGTEAERLLDELLRIELAGSGYRGGVARWLRDAVIPMLSARIAREPATADTIAPPTQEGQEGILVHGLAGPRAPSGRTVAWEGVTYLVDPGGAEAQRIGRVRRRQGENAIDQVLALSTAIESLGSEGDPETRDRTLMDAVTAIAPPQTNALVPADVVGTLRARADEWRRVRGAGAHQPIVDQLVALSDALLAHALMSLLYASYLGDPDDLALVDLNLAGRHDFGLSAATPDDRRRHAWALPVEQSGAGTVWHVSGSLFGFDVALAPQLLKRIIANQVPPAPRLATNDRQVFAQQVALMNPFLLTDEARDTIARGIAQGRRELAALATHSGAVPGVATRLRLGPRRARALEWVIGTDPTSDRVASLFSLSELFWLGVSGDTSSDTRQRVDPWGTSMVPLSGCLCARMPLPLRWEEFSGRPSTGLLATTIPDLSLRVAELLAEWRLPAMLARGVLAAAAQDLLDEAQPLHSFDWHTLVAQAQSISRDRFADYVSSLASGGPLIYVATSDARPRTRRSVGRPDP